MGLLDDIKAAFSGDDDSEGEATASQRDREMNRTPAPVDTSKTLAREDGESDLDYAMRKRKARKAYVAARQEWENSQGGARAAEPADEDEGDDVSSRRSTVEKAYNKSADALKEMGE